MRIHEVEIYTSKQILAFIEYLKVLAEEKKAQEDMQAQYMNNGQLGAVQGNALYAAKYAVDVASQINQGSAVG
jgi:hypothetical protein